jgi:hypothetical protein
MPPENLRALATMWRGGRVEALKAMTGDEIRAKAMCDGSFYRQLKQWEIIGIIHSYSEGEYAMNPEFAQDVEYTGFMEGL